MIAFKGRRGLLGLFRAVLAGGLALAGSPRSARAGLDEYVKKPDAAFAWVQASNHNTPAGAINSLKLTSQVWQGITWKHELTVYEPREIAFPDAMLLFITGGDNGSTPSDDDHKRGFALAQTLRSASRGLAASPQPAPPGRQDRGRIDRRDLRPLPRDQGRELAAALSDGQECGAGDGRPPGVDQGAKAGQPSRGLSWRVAPSEDGPPGSPVPSTTASSRSPPWSSSCSISASKGPTSSRSGGSYSEQIHDYVERGLMEKVETPAGTNLWRMVDPFTYRDRLTKPKLLINGTNDRYWTQNALDFYWDDLKGPKYLTEIPNAGHGLEVNRDWALDGSRSVLPLDCDRTSPAPADLGSGPRRRRRINPDHPRQPSPPGRPHLDRRVGHPRLPRVALGAVAARARRDDDSPGPPSSQRQHRVLRRARIPVGRHSLSPDDDIAGAWRAALRHRWRCRQALSVRHESEWFPLGLTEPPMAVSLRQLVRMTLLLFATGGASPAPINPSSRSSTPSSSPRLISTSPRSRLSSPRQRRRRSR